jgi:hypothetical protein
MLHRQPCNSKNIQLVKHFNVQIIDALKLDYKCDDINILKQIFIN